MRLGLSTAAYYGKLETEEAAALLPTLGLDCCEVFFETYSEYSAAFGVQVKQALAGLPATSVHPLGTQFESNLFGKSARQRADALRVYENVLIAGAAVGARCYVFHGPADLHRRGQGMSLAAHGGIIRDLCALAARHGLALAWENVWWCQLVTPAHVAMLRDAVPELRFVLDIKQALHVGIDPLALLSEMAGRLVNVHVCDVNAAGGLCLPGQGGFDFGGFFAALAAHGYDGPVILEPYSHLFETDAQLLAALTVLRTALYKAAPV